MSDFILDRYVSAQLLHSLRIPEECQQKRDFQTEEQLRTIVGLIRAINHSSLTPIEKNRLHTRCKSLFPKERIDLPYVNLPIWGKLSLDDTLAQTIKNIQEEIGKVNVNENDYPPRFPAPSPWNRRAIIESDGSWHFQASRLSLSRKKYIHIIQPIGCDIVSANIPPSGLIISHISPASAHAIILTDSLEGYKFTCDLFNLNKIDDITLVTWYSKDGTLPNLPLELLPDLPIYYILLSWKERPCQQSMSNIRIVAERWQALQRTHSLKVIDCRVGYRDGIYRYPLEFCRAFPLDKVPEDPFSSTRPVSAPSSYKVWAARRPPAHSSLILEHLIYSRRITLFEYNDTAALECVRFLLEKLARHESCIQGFQQKKATIETQELFDASQELRTPSLSDLAYGVSQQTVIPLTVFCVFWEVPFLPSEPSGLIRQLNGWIQSGAAVVVVCRTGAAHSFETQPDVIYVRATSMPQGKFRFQYKGARIRSGSFTCRISRTAKGDKLVKEQKHPAKKRNRRSEAEHAQLRLEVARLSESGMKIGDIATELNISRSSVNNYLEKLGRTRKRVTRDVVY